MCNKLHVCECVKYGQYSAIRFLYVLPVIGVFCMLYKLCECVNYSQQYAIRFLYVLIQTHCMLYAV